MVVGYTLGGGHAWREKHIAIVPHVDCSCGRHVLTSFQESPAKFDEQHFAIRRG